MFGRGNPFQKGDLPPGRLSDHLHALPQAAQHRALEWLHRFSFPAEDVHALEVDVQGGVYYVCEFQPLHGEEAEAATEGEPQALEASVPVSPFPEQLKFSSRPGAPNVIWLNFVGFSVTGTAWNSSLGRDPIPARAFSTDSDASTFSDAEQAAIKRIWQRVAEDYAPFNVDVTTIEPSTWNSRTAHVIITRSTDTNGQANPSSGAGGVAYVNVFGRTDYATYRPAWVYHNNLSNREDYIAEAASHEAGHNLGLSHDGKTDGTTYYIGHGSGDTSWGPIMGTGYNRNVSQWSKGEYYLANNTEDDLAILAGKLSYRASDHGGSLGTASFLHITSNTLVLATDPETDPANANPSNKGVIHQPADVDMWSFSTGSGDVDLAALPWKSPANTRGGNLDLRLTLLDSGGATLAVADPTTQTFARIQAFLSEGVYYVKVEPVGTGTPLSSSPSGYTVYGSLGQYFITGTVVNAGGLIVPPQAALSASDATQPGATSHIYQVTYSDNQAVSAATITNGTTYVTGPHGYSNLAALVGLDLNTDGTPRTATYRIPAPGGSWGASDNGLYTVWMASNAVFDVEGAAVPPGPLGAFNAALPNVIYAAYMDADPGWTLDAQWAYGQPAGASGDPSSGATGPNVIGYNLNGLYAFPLAAKYATTPVIDCSGTDVVILRFQRWLGLERNDTGAIELSVGNGSWTRLWTAPAPMADTSWQPAQFDLSSLAARQPNIRLRWVLAAARPDQPSFGWNIDDVEILGVSDNLDLTPPSASLFALDVGEPGAEFYAFSVTYTDDGSGVDISTLGDGNIVVTGPLAYTNAAVFAGVDDESTGSPRTAFYQIVPPGGAWDSADNGVYTIALNDSAVSDAAGNAVPGAALGTFTVDIQQIVPAYGALSAVLRPAKAIEQGARWRATSGAETNWLESGAVLENIEAGTVLTVAYKPLLGWEAPGDALTTISSGTTNDLDAVYTALYTTNHPTPLWWLIDQGYTSDFEAASESIGANGFALWESYIAGLDPANTASLFRVTSSATSATNSQWTITWSAVSGRTYSVFWMPQPGQPESPVPNAQGLAWPTNSFTFPIGSEPQGVLRLGVELPSP